MGGQRVHLAGSANWAFHFVYNPGVADTLDTRDEGDGFVPTHDARCFGEGFYQRE